MPVPYLIGRSAELERLSVLTGLHEEAPEAAAVIVGGDAGVGKTRLLVELGERAAAAGRQVLVGHCVDLGDSPPPYVPFTQVFGRLAAESPAQAAALVDYRPILGRLMPSWRPAEQEGRFVPRTDRVELFEAVGAGLSLLAEATPLILMIEDVHWADPSTREMLSYLFTHPASHRIAVIASYRSDDLHRRHPLRATLGEWARLPGVSRLALPPLSDSEVRALVQTLDTGPLSEADVRRIVNRAEGNPFFAEELVGASRLAGQALPSDLSDLLWCAWTAWTRRSG